MLISQYVYFALRSDTTTAAEMTARLLLEPDRIRVRGSRNPVQPIPGSHGWEVTAPPRNRQVGDQIDELVARLRPVADRIGALVLEGSVTAQLSVVRHFNDDEDGVEDDGTPPALAGQGLQKLGGQHHLLGWHLDRDVLAFLLTTGAVLDVDEYG